MDNKRTISTWLSVVLTVLCIGALVYDVYLIYILAPTGFSGALLQIVFSICTYCVALVYSCNGYKKNASSYYFLTCIGIALMSAVDLINTISLIQLSSLYKVTFAISLITFGIACVLVIVKNIGKKKSYIMSLALIILAIITSCIDIAIGGVAYISYFFLVALYIIFFIMVYAKYKDKELRGAN